MACNYPINCEQLTVTFGSKSSSINSISYDAESQKLTVEFHSGSTYGYDNVPLTVVNDMIHEMSVGSFFCKSIRNNKAYTYRKVEATVPSTDEDFTF